MQIPNPIEYFNNRLKKCRVDDYVYKDVNDIYDDDYKDYALFKIIELITNASVITYGHDKKYNLMKNLKKITYNCNPIIEKIFFDLLPEYKLLSNMEESTYFRLNIKIDSKDADYTTYLAFFKKHDLLRYVYNEKDPNKNYIFKVNAGKDYTKILLVQDDNENISIQSIENKFDKTAENPVEKEDIGDRNFSVVNYNSMSRNDTGGPTIKNITEISINNKEIADEYNKNIAKEQYGGNEKKQKVQSKPFKNKMLQNKEIFGKEMRIYKINGSKKEHVKYKGMFIPVSDYKMLIKKKNS